MKIFRFGAISVFLLISSLSFAQDKIGHINSAELLSMMPEVKVADTELQRVAKQLEDQERNMIMEYQRKMSELEAQQDSLMPSILEMRYNELQDMQARIQNFQQKAQDDLMKKKEQIYSPILERAENSIREVAKENGYKYVLDSGMGAVLYFEETDDIMPLVKKKLNLE